MTIVQCRGVIVIPRKIGNLFHTSLQTLKQIPCSKKLSCVLKRKMKLRFAEQYDIRVRLRPYNSVALRMLLTA